MPPVEALDPTADGGAHTPAQDESCDLPLALPSAAPTAEEAKPAASQEPPGRAAAQANDDHDARPYLVAISGDATARANDDRSPIADGQTDVITARDAGVS